MPSDVVELAIVIDAPRELVFSYFVDPERFVVWQGVVARLDPRPGGEFWLNVTGSEIASGRFVEVDPPNRVVFTWGWEQPGATVAPGASTVEVCLEPHGSGTRVLLRHHCLPTPTDRQAHRTGWTHYLDRLNVVATGGLPGSDLWAAREMPTIESSPEGTR